MIIFAARAVIASITAAGAVIAAITAAGVVIVAIAVAGVVVVTITVAGVVVVTIAVVGVIIVAITVIRICIVSRHSLAAVIAFTIIVCIDMVDARIKITWIVRVFGKWIIKGNIKYYICLR